MKTKGITRCMIFALAFILVAVAVPSVAKAQLHGAGILKACKPCTDVGEVQECEIQVVNIDGYNDTIRVLSAVDIIKGTITIPATGDLPIVAVSGSTTCAVGGNLPCDLGPNATVTFLSNEYVIQPDDPNPLPDQGQVGFQDLCNLAGTAGGCSTAQDSLTKTGNSAWCGPDADLCTTEACVDTNQDGIKDTCGMVDEVVCDDGNACTTESCNPTTGLCETTNTVVCNDGNACTTESCNTTTGQCETTNTVVCNDGNACTTESCNTTTGQCETTNTVVCNDGNACTTESCNTTTGQCETTNTVVCNDNNACTEDSCDTTTGQCVYSDPKVCSEDPNVPDVCEYCNPETGLCEIDLSLDPICQQQAICRTPGYWKTHAGTEKGAMNVTYDVIQKCGGCINVCGTAIDDTDICSTSSALEAMCDNPGKPFFHLTAMALNCCISGFGADCATGGDYLSNLFAEANNSCAMGESYRVDEIDCWNNGGMYKDGECWNGTCEGTDTFCKETTWDCNCIAFLNNCHTMELCNDVWGVCYDGVPAGSSKACNDAKKNNCGVSADGGNCD